MPRPDQIDPEVEQLARERIARHPSGRVSTLLREILQNGFVTTERLQQLGLSEPRRAKQDAVDLGFPITSIAVRSTTGRRIASYSLGEASSIQASRVGRSSIPRKFRNKLLSFYGSRDGITGAELDSRVLTVDHRVPYQVGGDKGLAEQDASAFMLLDAKSQRSKSWSCEQCLNFRELRDPKVCKSCFWAYPESYRHIAMQEICRTDIMWTGDDVPVHDRLKATADRAGIPLSELLLRLARRRT